MTRTSRQLQAICAIVSYVLCTHSVSAETCALEPESGKNYVQFASSYVEQCAGTISDFQTARSMKLHVDRLAANSAEFAKRGPGAKDLASLQKDRQRILREALLAMVAIARETDSNVAARDELIRALQCDLEMIEAQAPGVALPDRFDERCPATPPARDEASVTGRTVYIDAGKWTPEFQPDTGIVWNRAIVGPLLELRDPDNAESNCAQREADASSQCHALVLRDFAPVLGLLAIMHNQLIPAANDTQAQIVAEFYSTRHEQWKYYLSDTGFQYPWELSWNKRVHGGFEEVATNRAPPTWRLTALHPTAAIYYGPDLPDGSDTSLAGVVKLIGAKHWQFDANTNRPTGIWGLSVIGTFADLPGVEDSGIGLMLDYNSFSVGYSKHGGDGVWMINMDFSKFLSDRPDDLPGWLDLLRDD